MRSAHVDGRFESWQRTARALLREHVSPADVVWHDAGESQLTLGTQPEPDTAEHRAAPAVAVPRSFVSRARVAACHVNPARWDVLYRLLWRITHGDRQSADDPLDPDARVLATMVQQVRRDEHKMHAFVRFRKVVDADGEVYIAFHRPDHHIVRLAAPFFVERFRVMRWSILTPDECAHWDRHQLTFTPGVDASAAPQEDEVEALWRAYYAAIFNPARVNPDAMIRELPVRHWPTLPEAQLIPSLVAAATPRVDQMLREPGSATSARPFVPSHDATFETLAQAATACRGCALFASATQTVFGEGPAHARLMLVGEQPGDEEDRVGRPFVGPAGEVLAEAIARAALDRHALYVTNAVKHFRFRREGKRRIHERPRVSDVRACRPWLEAEIAHVQPEVVVCLGSTAAQALLGPRVRVQRDRGQMLSSHWAKVVMPTYHPSAVLRADTPAHQQEIFEWLVTDLRAAAAQLTANG